MVGVTFSSPIQSMPGEADAVDIRCYVLCYVKGNLDILGRDVLLQMGNVIWLAEIISRLY